MSIFHSITQVLSAFLVPLVVLDTPLSPYRLFRLPGRSIFIAYLFLYGMVVFWTGLVNSSVPEPYLDEVFHIPQAQAYCDARYDVWDPKLTTPPGLYVFATVFAKAYWRTCAPWVLRMFNGITLLMILSYASDCRTLVTWTWKQNPANVVAKWSKTTRQLSPEALHMALNIALFPPLFFFSGLFYTDVLSTCVVLRMYRLYLERQGAYENSAKGLLWLYPIGIIALTMRQTNIFWVAVFLGALELVRTITSNATRESEKIQVSWSWQETLVFKFKHYSQGKIHDIHLKDAGLHDFIFCTISIAVAALFRPLLLASRLWPYVLLLMSFVGFVFWNGGVVLGDKTNHIATIHLPQMLYIWPFITFFSAPLIIPIGIRFLQDLARLLSIPLFPRLMWKYFFTALYAGVALSATLFIIKFNTVIHPFTLADNRHYIFYVFRYTILRHPLIPYLLAPVYLVCSWLVYLTLCTASEPPTPARFQDRKSPATQKSLPKPKENTAQGPKTSFVIVLLASTALSLIGAPLVEPRYFIIPWVVWRLNVPGLSSNTQKSSLSTQKSPAQISTTEKLLSRVRYWGWEGHDYRLWIETAWFLLINAVTGYIFLYRGFEWPQEPGKVQRFMW